jgi:alcohol dehydrogenase (cytochrome c)
VPEGAAAGEAAAGGGGRGGGGGGPDYPIVVGGLGNGDANTCGSARIGGGILVVDGVLYAASPNNVFAVDARDGAVLWHNYWKSRGGTTTGTRGPGMWHNYIYFSQHDDWVVALDARNGKEIWRHEVAPFDQQYFSSNAPMPIGDHLLVGTGNDLDATAFLKSLDPRTGAVQWIWYATAQKEGDPGLETWASLDAARHGNGATWIPGVYDPETKLYIFGTGNPTPSYTTGRGEGDNLFTSCLVALNVDTGKMAWYYQTSPHDTHDWDSTQTPVMFDGMFKRPDAEDGHDRHAQRLFLRGGSHNGRASRDEQAWHRQQLDVRLGCEGAAQAESAQGRGNCRGARQWRRDELSAPHLLARDRPVLRQ